MQCELCEIILEEYRLIKETAHSYSIICLEPIKSGHLMIAPKRHVTQNGFSELTAEEAKDFLTLIEDMQHLLTEKYDEDIMLFKNSNSHSSQPHFHMHLLPSEANMRKLIATYHSIPTHPEVSKETYTEMKAFLLQ